MVPSEFHLIWRQALGGNSCSSRWGGGWCLCLEVGFSTSSINRVASLREAIMLLIFKLGCKVWWNGLLRFGYLLEVMNIFDFISSGLHWCSEVLLYDKHSSSLTISAEILWGRWDEVRAEITLIMANYYHRYLDGLWLSHLLLNVPE